MKHGLQQSQIKLKFRQFLNRYNYLVRKYNQIIRPSFIFWNVYFLFLISRSWPEVRDGCCLSAEGVSHSVTTGPISDVIEVRVCLAFGLCFERLCKCCSLSCVPIRLFKWKTRNERNTVFKNGYIWIDGHWPVCLSSKTILAKWFYITL